MPQITDAAPVTLSLVFGAVLIWVVVAIAMGTVAAVMRGTFVDPLLMVIGLIGISMPVFWLGEVVNLITQSRLHDELFSWLPPLGYTPITADPALWFKHLIFPWLTLSVLYIGLLRARAARRAWSRRRTRITCAPPAPKGIKEQRVLLRHVLRNSMIAFVSLLGLDFGALVAGGALLTEVVFGLPGVGKLTYDSLENLDLPGDHGDGHVRVVLRRHRERGRRHRLRPPRSARARWLSEPLLEVRDLRVSFRTEDGLVRAVDGVSFDVAPGEVLGIVGESGSGKSVTVMSIMRLIRDPNAVFEGEVIYKGRDLLKLELGQMREVRGSEIAMIFQDPMTSLNPVYRVGWQIAEQVRAHEKISKADAHRRAIELLDSCRHPRAAAARRRLSAPVLGRHAPARDDRDGALLQSRPADRRRADDGARRHDPGADPGADPQAAHRLRLRDRADHARHGRRRRRGRPRLRDVRGPHRGGRARRASCSRTRSIRTRGGCWARSRASTGPGRTA